MYRFTFTSEWRTATKTGIDQIFDHLYANGMKRAEALLKRYRENCMVCQFWQIGQF